MVDQENGIPNVYSYLKFKEMAEDRMSQVKIFVQNSEDWESSGFGMLHFFQINSNNNRKELIKLSDYDASIPNLFAAIEIVDISSFSESELAALKKNYHILNSRNVKLETIAVFYDFYNGTDYDFDFNSFVIRKSNQLASSQITKSSHCYVICVRWNIHQNLGIFVCYNSRFETHFTITQFREY